jgi:hypothetical protein
MLRKIMLVVPLVFIVGCSSLSLTTLDGPMDQLSNHRYGYHMLIPDGWKHSINSNIRPTELTMKARKTDAAIIVLISEGHTSPDMAKFIESRTRHKGTESFTLVRSWRLPFDDNTGYIVNFVWKGTMLFGDAEHGKKGVEYQATIAVVERDPSPIMLVCYAPKKEFKEFNNNIFAHARDSLKVEPVELTIREVPEN